MYSGIWLCGFALTFIGAGYYDPEAEWNDVGFVMFVAVLSMLWPIILPIALMLKFQAFAVERGKKRLAHKKIRIAQLEEQQRQIEMVEEELERDLKGVI